MADWIHCNLCFIQPGKGTRFHVTSCGHIYCERCVSKGSKDTCKMCASKNSTVELSGKLKPEVEMYFLDPSDLISKAFKKFIQAYEFQKNHRRRLYTHLLATVEEQKKVLQEAKRMLVSAQSMEKEFLRLKEENVYLKKLVQDKGLGNGSRPSSRSGFSPTSVFRNSPTGLIASRQASHCTSHQGITSNGTQETAAFNSHAVAAQNQSTRVTQPNLTPKRMIARTPPSGGKMGTVGSGSPADHMNILCFTPKSVPHHLYTPVL